MGLRVTVHYPFHPWCGRELEVLCVPRDRQESVVVVDPNGGHLKIPRWMISIEAGRYTLSEQAEIDPQALLGLARLLPAVLWERTR
jgi:hypothetical protein